MLNFRMKAEGLQLASLLNATMSHGLAEAHAVSGDHAKAAKAFEEAASGYWLAGYTATAEHCGNKSDDHTLSAVKAGTITAPGIFG